VRSVDERRVLATYGGLAAAALEAIDEGLRVFLELGPAEE